MRLANISGRLALVTGDGATDVERASQGRFGPIGPYVVTLDELDDPEDLRLESSLNGEIVQAGSTNQMMFPVRELIARLSTVCVLFPGDLIFTGTPPGVGMGRKPPRYLASGDTLVSSIEGIGSMVHRFVEPRRAAITSRPR